MTSDQIVTRQSRRFLFELVCGNDITGIGIIEEVINLSFVLLETEKILQFWEQRLILD